MVAGDALVSATYRSGSWIGMVRDRKGVRAAASPRFARSLNVMREGRNDGILCMDGDAIEGVTVRW